ncbi:MAG: hypothetical protein ACTH98_06930 [Corynebacterium flavescens]|uniref:hypothetical protein n=1 Tax=Corynebacterium flavescens TaxID=28028 RepID=UPI003F939D7D
MNQVIDCAHCGAVNVIPDDEYFSGICESCGHDTNQIPEQEPDMSPNDLTLTDLAALAIGHLILDRELTDEQLDGNGDMTHTMGQINAALDKAGINRNWFKDRLAMYLPKV